MSAVTKKRSAINIILMDKLKYLNLSQQTGDIDPMLVQCWVDWVDVSCLPGMVMDVPAHTCPEVRTLYEHSENILFRLRHFTEIVSENYLNLSKY